MKRWIKGIVLSLGIALIALFPTIVASRAFEPIIQMVCVPFSIQISYESLNLGWFSGTRVSKLSVETSAYSLELPSASTSTGLLRTLFMRDLGDVYLESPVLSLKVSDISSDSSGRGFYFSKLLVKNGSLELKSPNSDSAWIKEIAFQMEHDFEKSPYKGSIEAKTVHKKEIGSINGTFSIPGSSDTPLLIKLAFSQFPTEFIDYGIGLQNGRFPFSNIFGPIAQGSIEVDQTENGPEIGYQISLDRLSIQGAFVLSNGLLSGTKEQKITISITEPFSTWIQESTHLPQIAGNVFLNISRIEVPYLNGSFQAPLNCTLSAKSAGTLGNAPYECVFSSLDFQKMKGISLNALFSAGEKNGDISGKMGCTLSASIAQDDIVIDTLEYSAKTFPISFIKSLFPRLSQFPLGKTLSSTIAIRDRKGSANFSSEQLQLNSSEIALSTHLFSIGKSTLTVLPLSTSVDKVQIRCITPLSLSCSDIQYSIQEKTLNRGELKAAPFTALLSDHNGSIMIKEGSFEASMLEANVSQIGGNGTLVLSDTSHGASEEVFASIQGSIYGLDRLKLTTTLTKSIEAVISVEHSNGITTITTPKLTLHSSPITVSNILENHQLPIRVVKTPGMVVEMLTLSIENGLVNGSFSASADQLVLSSTAVEKQFQIDTINSQSRIKNNQFSTAGNIIFGSEEKASFEATLTPSKEGEIAISLSRFPTKSFVLIGKEYENAIGTHISGSIHLTSKEDSWNGIVDLKSSQLAVIAKCKVDSSGIEFGKSTCSWILTKAGYNSFVTTPIPFALKDEIRMKILVEQGLFPYPFSWDSAAISASAQSTPFTIALENTSVEAQMSGKINKQKNEHEMALSFSGAITTEEKRVREDGEISAYCTVAFSPKLSCSGTISLDHFPTVLTDFILAPSGGILPSTFLGPFISIEANSAIKDGSGPIKIELSSKEAQGSVEAELRNEILFLKAPIKLSLVVTPNLSRALLGSMEVDFASTQKPLQFVVNPSGFSLPLQKNWQESITVQSAYLDMGQILVLSRGTVQDINEILRKKAPKDSLHLWFAPLEFSIDRGIMRIGRCEVLYDKQLDLAIWGNINLVTESVKMTLGITASALQTAVGIRGLPKDYVLQIPVVGKFGNISIDKTAASAKIALLIARQAKGKSNSPWGAAIDILGELADDQGSVPKAKRPFPWETPVR